MGHGDETPRVPSENTHTLVNVAQFPLPKGLASKRNGEGAMWGGVGKARRIFGSAVSHWHVKLMVTAAGCLGGGRDCGGAPPPDFNAATAAAMAAEAAAAEIAVGDEGGLLWPEEPSPMLFSPPVVPSSLPFLWPF